MVEDGAILVAARISKGGLGTAVFDDGTTVRVAVAWKEVVYVIDVREYSENKQKEQKRGLGGAGEHRVASSEE